MTKKIILLVLSVWHLNLKCQEVFSYTDSMIVIGDYNILGIKPTKIPDTIAIRKDSIDFTFYVKSYRGDMDMIAFTPSKKLYAKGSFEGGRDLLSGYKIEFDIITYNYLVTLYHYFRAIPVGTRYSPNGPPNFEELQPTKVVYRN